MKGTPVACLILLSGVLVGMLWDSFYTSFVLPQERKGGHPDGLLDSIFLEAVSLPVSEMEVEPALAGQPSSYCYEEACEFVWGPVHL